MIIAHKTAILRYRPKPQCSANAAVPYYNFLCSLDSAGFHIGSKLKAYLEKCGDVQKIKVNKLGEGKKRSATRLPVEHDLSNTVIKIADVATKTFSDKDRPRLVWGKQKEIISLPSIITPKEGIIGLHQRWKVTFETMDDEFWAWINSINRGFQHTEPYVKFDSYVEQASSWLSDHRSIMDCTTDSQRDNFVMRELERFDCNKLYFLNKYWRYQDASSRTGFSIFKAGKAQAILAYLYDCRWDIDLAKARQAFLTTMFYGISVAETLIHPSFFIKIITADLIKAEETFLQKLRLPFADLPPYMRPSITDNAHGVYQSKRQFELRERGGSLSSLISIVPPSIDAVNSGSPDLRIIDEQGLISIIKEIRNEMKSSALKEDKKTGTLVRKGQTLSFGSSDAIQFPQFETIHRSAKDAWEKKNISMFDAIPLYLNVWARPAMTQKIYDAFYLQAYSDTSTKRQHTITQFHQSFPIDYDDMFISNPLTLIDMNAIQTALKRIDNAPAEKRCEFGFFTPIFDQSNQAVKSADQPFHIVGAEFVKCKDVSDPRVTWCIFEHPDRHAKWVDRYFAGTDPIMGAEGHSRFGKTILDGLDSLPKALMASRSRSPDYEYLQSLLGSLYYGDAVDELIEENLGAPYIKWLTDNGYDYLIIPRQSLPLIYQSGGLGVYGISKKAGGTARHILNSGWQYLDRFHDQIWIKQYFTELKTYVNIPTTQSSKQGDHITAQFRYQPKDRDVYFDDALDSLFYATIALEAYGFKKPHNLSENTGEKKKVWRRMRDSNFNLINVQVEEYQ